jgi:L-alanine-DL-glutamate epimerase-like enolase superfamily enzyme
MRIADVEALLLRQPHVDASVADGSQDALIIRIHSDEGITGLGEVDSLPLAVKAIIDSPASHQNATGLRTLLIGQDPFEIRKLWQRLYAGSIYYGRRGVALHAISGIDIALWDIVGRATGKPIHALLGGARRERIRAYASILMPETTDEVHRVVSAQREAGFNAIKLGWGPLGRDAEVDVALTAAARKAGGEDFDLMIDIGFGWRSVREGLDRARRMEPYRLYWIEEPFMPNDYAKYRALSSALETPLAAGEHETTRWDFERLIESGVDVVQPDVTRAGGISETVRIAELAAEAGRRCVLHSWSTGIIKAASLQVLAAMDEAEYFEYCVQETDLNRRLVKQRFPISDGMVEISREPGLGIELDDEVLVDCLVEVTT